MIDYKHLHRSNQEQKEQTEEKFTMKQIVGNSLSFWLVVSVMGYAIAGFLS